MRTSSVAAAAAAAVVAVLGASSVVAQPPMPEKEFTDIRVPIAAISCRTTPLQAVRPDPDVIESIDGAYRLSNGQKLELAAENERVVADFGRWSQVPLVPVAPNRFESRDGLVRLRYEADERVERIVVSYPADQRGRFVDVC